MVVSVSEAMTKIRGSKMATSEYVVVWRLRCDIARVIVWGNYLANLALTTRTLQAMLVVVPLVVAVVAKYNLTTF